MATILEESVENQVKQILDSAKNESIKGRLYEYERYKRELQDVCVSSVQLGKATIELAKILKI